MSDLVRRSDVLKTLADASINGYITHKINAIEPAMKWIPCSVKLPEVYKPVYIWMVPKKDGYLSSDAEPQKRLAYYSDMRTHFLDLGTHDIISDNFDIPYWMDINLIPPPDTDFI